MIFEARKKGTENLNAIAIRPLFLVLVAVAALFATAQLAAAEGTPTKIIVFTDKKTYTGWLYDTPKGGTTLAPVGDLSFANLRIIVYAVVLDDDGNIMTGRASNLWGSANETQKLSPGGAAGHHVVTNNPNVFGNFSLTFVDDGSIPEDTANDGIYTAIADLNDSKGSSLAGEHFKYNISVTDPVAGKQFTEVLISGITCMQSLTTYDHNDASQHVSQTGADDCAVCHHGYEHWYENESSTFSDTQLDIHAFKTSGIDVTSRSAQHQVFNSYRWNYSDSGNNRATPDNWEAQVPGSKYCAMCHMNFTDPGTYSTVDKVFDYGSGTRNDPTDIPSCNNSICHKNGKTSFENTLVPSWQPSAMGGVKEGSNENITKARAHNHTTTNPSRVACVLCHDTTHSYNLPNMTRNTTSSPINEQCWLCHNITGGLNITSNAVSIAHTTTNNNCDTCHRNGAGALDVHLVPMGASGGPNCTSCHYLGSPYHNINVTAVNASVHKAMNNLNATRAGVSAINGACWACHDSDGNVTNNPSGQEMGDIYNTPKTCTDCHLGTGTYNTSAYRAIVVSEHYDISNPAVDSVVAGNSTSEIGSCINCHENVSEMILYNGDPDTGTFAGDGVGVTGGNRSYYHYGRPRKDMRVGTSENCLYCHQNYSTAFTNAMQKPDVSKYIYNHTNSPLTTQKCITCHGSSGWIHNSTLKKDSLYGNGYCTFCHSNQLGEVRPIDYTHSNSINCWNCHQDPNGTMYQAPIHGMMYPQANGSYLRYDKGTPANCTTCHVDGLVNTSTNYATRIPKLNHSTDPYAGTKWGSYWNNTSAITACYYCHQSEIHLPLDPANDPQGLGRSLLGNVQTIRGSNTLKNPDLTTSTWCANCHYIGATEYAGASLAVPPPEITNSSLTSNDGTPFYDHTNIVASNYADSKCKQCHALVGPYLINSLNYSHSLNEGVAGGPNCIECHNLETALNAPVGINFTAANASVHFGVNRDNATNQGYAPVIGACWACHDSDGNVTSGHPDRYKTPKTCDECHLGTGTYNASAYNAIVVSEHYYSGAQIKAGNAASNISSCINCHENVSEMVLYNNDTDTGSFPGDGIGATGGSTSFYHYGKNRSSELRTWDSGRAENCSYCHQNGTTAFTIAMSNAGYNSSIKNHSQSNPPSCTNSTCHSSGWIHNSTLNKPLLPLPNTTYCQNCHTDKQKHNGTQDCSSCHINQTSDDTIHPVKFIQNTGTYSQVRASAANCTDCHQTGLSLFNSAPIIPGVLKHSSNLSNGSIWGTYWNSSMGASSSCYYCHNNTKHNATALGSVKALLNSNNVRNGSVASTGWCADCHYNSPINANYLGYQWNPVPPLITINNTGKSRWVNHTSYIAGGYNDNDCKTCHALNGAYAPTSLNYSHSLDTGVSGGPDCISCHFVGSSYHNIDTVAANSSAHFGMNSNNATSAGFAAIDGACWACHDTDGNTTNNPSDKVMGDIYNAPKKCNDCHLSTGTYYQQSISWGGLTVKEHYYAGDQIKAGNSSSDISSCINCHENVSEMVLANSDPDYGTFAGDGIRLTGGNKSFYHYGKPRQDIRTWDSGRAENCSYCHQNGTTAFASAMVDPGYNSTINNHSQANSPTCYNSTCHNSGWLHNSTLTRPALPLPNTTYCQNCHATKDKHNGTLDCSRCHIDTTSSDTIHPVKYVQTSGAFSQTRTTAVNCTDCHQGTGVSGFAAAPKVPKPLNHSTDPYAGEKWGNYWDNTSTITACYYCHQSDVHKSNAPLLGNVSTVKGSNTFNNPDLTTSTWCANCHYAGASEYKGNQLLISPPEITNSSLVARDGTQFYNHSADVVSTYKDSKCKECHGNALSRYSETTRNFSHSVSEGGGGPDCVSSGCHGATGSPSSPYMNWTSLKTGMHAGLNSGADTTGMTDPIVAACWACHGDGTKPSGHPANYKQPYYCTECHLASGSLASKYSAKIVTEHQHVNAQVQTNSTYARCENCHNNSLVRYTDNETNPSTVLTNYTTGNVSHYGANKTAGKLMYNSSGNSEDCVYCHLNNSNRQKWANATNASATKPSIHGNYSATTPSSECWKCHVDGGASAVTPEFTLHNESLNPGASQYCLNCHVPGGSAQNLTVTSERMGMHIDLNTSEGTGVLNNSDCLTCHFGYPNGVSGTHSFNVNPQNTYYCNDCHGPNKNSTAVLNGIDAKSKIISQFQHATLDCAGCHAANETRRPGGVRVSIYHNSSAKANALGVVSNPGWGMINGLFVGCTDCHRVKNSRDIPFRAPGAVHYTTTESTCGANNCHAPPETPTDPHYQVYLPCSELPCQTFGPSAYPPVVSNLSLSPPVVNQSEFVFTTVLMAKAQDNYNTIESAKYRITNASKSVVVDWTQMSPADGRWGPSSRTEVVTAEIDVSALPPGTYAVEVEAMAGGPRTHAGPYYPDNGEWSAIKSVTLEVRP